MIIYIYTIRKVPEGVGLKTGWNQYWLGRPAKPYNEGPIASLRGDDIDVPELPAGTNTKGKGPFPAIVVKYRARMQQRKKLSKFQSVYRGMIDRIKTKPSYKKNPSNQAEVDAMYDDAMTETLKIPGVKNRPRFSQLEPTTLYNLLSTLALKKKKEEAEKKKKKKGNGPPARKRRRRK